MPDMGAVLQAACEDVITDPALRPIYAKDGVTLRKSFCNVGTARVAARLGCNDFTEDMNAEAMIALVRASGDKQTPAGWVGPKPKCWKIVDGRTATLHALDGGFGMAFMDKARLDEDHAHVTAIWPKGMQRSESLGHDVPMLANVGAGDPDAPLTTLPDGKKTKRNWCCKSSQAFPVSCGEAEYAIWA